MVLYTLSLALVPSGDSDSSQTKISFHGRLLDWEYQDVLSYSAEPLGNIFNNACSFCIPLKWNFPHYHPWSADSNVMDSAEEQRGMRRTRIHTELGCSNPWPLWWGCCNSRVEAQSQSEPLHMTSLVPWTSSGVFQSHSGSPWKGSMETNNSKSLLAAEKWAVVPCAWHHPSPGSINSAGWGDPWLYRFCEYEYQPRQMNPAQIEQFSKRKISY